MEENKKNSFSQIFADFLVLTLFFYFFVAFLNKLIDPQPGDISMGISLVVMLFFGGMILWYLKTISDR